MKRFFKTENERPGGPKEGSFEEIMEDILNPASYGVEEEVGSIMDNVTSVEIQDHKWKNYQEIWYRYDDAFLSCVYETSSSQYFNFSESR